MIAALFIIGLVIAIYLSWLKKKFEVQIVSADEKEKPLCPHCGEELSTLISHRSHLRLLYNLHVLACPECRKVLRVSTTLK